jgi:protein-tyrosine phosphatase
MTILQTLERHIALEGALNFRDFGGYKTQQGGHIKSGHFFRSDKLNTLSDNDHQILAPLEIASIFDLRRPDECEYAPTRWIPQSKTQTHYYSLIKPENSTAAMMQKVSHLKDSENAGKEAMKWLYGQLILEPTSRAYLANIFNYLLNNPSQKILVHCSGGKDRTGVTCALIQWVLGCDQATIYEDYLLSKTLYSDRVDSQAKFQQLAKVEEKSGLKPEWIEAIMAVSHHYLDAMFETLLENYNDVEDFLETGLQLEKHSPERLREYYVS